MQQFLVILATVFWMAFAATTVHATALTSIYSPAMEDGNALGGGMLMPYVTYDSATKTLSITPPSSSDLSSMTPNGTPVLATLDQWVPGATFANTSAAYYSLLDPVGGQGLAFSNQYGFTAVSDLASTLDSAGLSLGIQLVSSSAGLTFYNSSGSVFDQVFNGSDDSVLWGGGMWHFYAATAETDIATTYSATFEIFVANTTIGTKIGQVDESTVAGEATGYTSTTITLNWTTVPEPSTYTLFGIGAIVLGGAVWKRRTVSAPSFISAVS